MDFFRVGHFCLIWTMKPELGEKFSSEAPVGGEGGFWWGLEMVWVGCFEGRSGGFLVARVILGVMLGKIWGSGKMTFFWGVERAGVDRVKSTGIGLRVNIFAKAWERWLRRGQGGSGRV